jgi:hypothetical protein
VLPRVNRKNTGVPCTVAAANSRDQGSHASGVTRSDILALAFRELIERLAGEFSARGSHRPPGMPPLNGCVVPAHAGIPTKNNVSAQSIFPEFRSEILPVGPGSCFSSANCHFGAMRCFLQQGLGLGGLPGRRAPPLSTSGIKPVALVFSIDEVKNSRSPNCSGSCGRDGPKQDMTGCRYQLDARFQHSACNEGAKPTRRMVSGQVAFGSVSDDGVDDGVVVPHI